MGDVSQILGRLESEKKESGSRQNGKPQQEWQLMQSRSVEVGDCNTNVRIQRRGALFSLGFVNNEGRPSTITGPAAVLKTAREELIAQFIAGLDAIEAADAEHQKRMAEKKHAPNPGGPSVEVRHTGKTERERLKKLNKNKA